MRLFILKYLRHFRNAGLVFASVLLFSNQAISQSSDEQINQEILDRNQYDDPVVITPPAAQQSQSDTDNDNGSDNPPSPFATDEERFGRDRYPYGLESSTRRRSDFNPNMLAEDREAAMKLDEIDPNRMAEERIRLESLRKRQAGQSRNGSASGRDEQNRDTDYSDPNREPGTAERQNAQRSESLENDGSAESDPEDETRTNRQLSRPDGAETSYDEYSAANPYYEENPYQPLGVRAGSFLLFPSIVMDSVYSDNLFLSNSNKKGDVALELRPSFVAESQWSRHQLRAEASGTRSFHKEYTSEDDEDLLLAVNGRIDVTRDTNLEGETSYNLTQETRGTIDGAIGNGPRSDIVTTAYGGGINHNINRFSISLRGAVAEIDYSNATLSDGTIDNNDDRDYRETIETVRLGYEFKPGFTAFVQGELNQRDFKQDIDDNGFRSGSDGYEIRGGLGIDIGPKIRGEISLGFASQESDDPRLQQIEGFVVNSDLTWRPNALTTWHLIAASEIGETNVSGASGIFSQSYGLDVRHALRRHFYLTAAVKYLMEGYEGASIEENELTLSAGAEYIFNRYSAIVAQYQFTDFDSSEIAGDYQENEVRLGIRLTR